MKINEIKNKIFLGDSKEVLSTFPEKSIDCCVTSPPYWNLRNYDVEGQLGMESNFNEYIQKLCDVFDEVYRVLKDTGTCWVNISDTYFGGGNNKGNTKAISKKQGSVKGAQGQVKNNWKAMTFQKQCLCGIPERFMLEMINRGWILRNKIIWKKPNCFPTSVKNRFTVDWEYMYFFVKKKGYYFEQQFEPMSENSDVHYRRQLRKNKKYNSKEPYKKNIPYSGSKYKHDNVKVQSQDSPNRFWEDDESMKRQLEKGRNKRAVWDINTKPSKTKHIATYPRELIRSPIQAGCPEQGIVLDPFIGSGTTAIEAYSQNKNFVGIELNEDNLKECQLIINNFIKKNK